MLKLTYTEDSFYLELLAQPLETWLSTRAILAIRSGISLWVDSSTASFLLPADLPQLEDLEEAITQDEVEGITLCISDAETVEVCLDGTWVAEAVEAKGGILITAMSSATEMLLYELWAQVYACAICE
jgi:hypothetical protein